MKKINSPHKKVVLGLSFHRPELIPFIADHMRESEAIFLEEPREADFAKMLAGSLPIDDYLRPLDMEYPAFSHTMCSLLRDLMEEGKQIFQVEPYLEVLVDIHKFFAEGHSPAELNKNSLQYPVYLAERNATGALLSYYKTVMTGSFEKTVEAVKRFARLDAARFRLRDSLRAQALAPLVEHYSSAYIEAGLIHYSLRRQLQAQLSPSTRLQVVFLADKALKLCGNNRSKKHLYGPGDQLTLLYIFHSNLSQPKRETILAARSLIYSKLIAKDEMTDDLRALPHLRDELACIQIANRLALQDCRHLFPLTRHAGTEAAHKIVAEYLADSKSPRRANYRRFSHQHIANALQNRKSGDEML